MYTYYSNVDNDVSSIMEKINNIDEDFEELKKNGELTEEDIFNINYRKMMQIMKLNTGYVRLY